MPVKYEYETIDEFIKDRAWETHISLKAAAINDVLFGQILRNVMKHSFACGVAYARGQKPDVDYE